MRGLLVKFAAWAIRHTRRKGVAPLSVVTFAGDFLFWRYEFLWPDEWPDAWWDKCRDTKRVRPHALPWWRPFNAFVHRWDMAPQIREPIHDHPRWSISVCLKGQIIERTPWGERLLKAGSIVFRSHKAIHSFEIPQGFGSRTYTLFIVGRRKHRQNSYEVTAK